MHRYLSRVKPFLRIGVGIDFFSLRQSFDSHFDFFGLHICTLKGLGEACHDIGYGFLHHVVERQTVAIHPEFSFKILLNYAMAIKQNNSPPKFLLLCADKDF